MAVTNGWGQAAVNNTIDYGKGKTTATNDWGKVYDSSASGDTSLGTAAGFSNTKSIELDGVDDFVNVPDNANLSFGNGTTDSPFSISVWVKVDDLDSSHTLIEKRLSSGFNDNEYILYIASDGSIANNIYDGHTLNRRGRKTSSGIISIDTWHHIVMTYNGVGGSSASAGIKIYLDSSQVDNANNQKNVYTAMHNTSQPVKIGEFIAGHIDEAAIFSSELSASDVTAIYNSGVPASLSSYSSLVSWWRCGDGDTAPTLTDNGTGGNNGTMTNFSTFSTDVPT